MNKIGYFERRQVGDREIFLGASTTLLEFYERAFVSAGGSAVTAPVITLKNLSRMSGRKQVIQCIDIDNTTTDRVVVNYADGGLAADTTGINTTDVAIEFESNGRNWVLTRSAV